MAPQDMDKGQVHSLTKQEDRSDGQGSGSQERVTWTVDSDPGAGDNADHLRKVGATVDAA